MQKTHNCVDIIGSYLTSRVPNQPPLGISALFKEGQIVGATLAELLCWITRTIVSSYHAHLNSFVCAI